MRCKVPIRVKNNRKSNSDFLYNTVPCGKCLDCLKKRATNWSFRLQIEEKFHNIAYFVTLTYSDEYVPVTEHGELTLNKRDLQLFLKRVRKATSCKTVRYYAVGEYGSTTQRPHYHLILFDVKDTVINACWTHPTSKIALGITDIQPVSPASVRYVTNYVCKPRLNDDELHGKQREFSTMSKGLGSQYLTPAMQAWHTQNLNNFVIQRGGIRLPLPRYYKDKLFDDRQKSQLKLVQNLYDIENERLIIKEYGTLVNYERNLAALADQNAYKLQFNHRSKRQKV